MNFATRVAYLASTLATLIVTGSFTLSSMTLGSVLFAGTGGLVSQDNANFFWDDTNNRLGIGTNSPVTALHVAKDVTAGPGGGAYGQLELTGTTDTAKRLSVGYNTSANYGFIQSMTNAASFDALVLNPNTGGTGGGYIGINTGGTVPASVLEIFQTPTDATGASADTQRIRISGGTTTNLARGIDFTYEGTRIHSITSNANGLLRILSANTASVEVAGAIQTSATPSVLLSNIGSATGTDLAFTGSSASQVGVKMDHTINQTSTAAFDSLRINRVNTAVGSGNQNFLNLTVSDTTRFRIDDTGHVFMDATVTAGGTTGNQTINKPSGTVNIAAAGTAVTVTNSTVSANSIVTSVARTNDATCSVKNVVPGAGSFVINLTAACTAETSFGFVVFN